MYLHLIFCCWESFYLLWVEQISRLVTGLRANYVGSLLTVDCYCTEDVVSVLVIDLVLVNKIAMPIPLFLCEHEPQLKTLYYGARDQC